MTSGVEPLLISHTPPNSKRINLVSLKSETMDSSNLVIESQIDSKTYDNSYGSGNISAPIGTKSGGERQRRRMQDYKSNIPIWNEEEGVKWSICEYILMFFAWFICLIIPLFWFFLIKTVRDYERALIFRLGKLKGGAEGPGVFFVNPLMDSIFVVDLRMETFDLPPQGIIHYRKKNTRSNNVS